MYSISFSYMNRFGNCVCATVTVPVTLSIFLGMLFMQEKSRKGLAMHV